MSTAAKTTPRTRLKLKEAQDEIAELRLALAQHAVLNHNLQAKTLTIGMRMRSPKIKH
jgi:hypothetical protein